MTVAEILPTGNTLLLNNHRKSANPNYVTNILGMLTLCRLARLQKFDNLEEGLNRPGACHLSGFL